MKKVKFLLLISLVTVIYSCKKESETNDAIQKGSSITVDTRAVVVDSSAFKRLMEEENRSIIYNEIKKVKKVSNYAEGPMQSFDFSFKDYSFKIRYIEDRAYIQYRIDHKIIADWKFCNVNFYYDSSWETVEEDCHLLYNGTDLSGVLLFPGFTEEYATYFVYEFNNNTLQFVNVVTLNRTLSADVWTNPHEFRAVRKKNKLQISLLDKDGKEYVFENGEGDPEKEPENQNISKDLIVLKTADGNIK
ncbi:hypothetical protein [Chryseobacterium sp. BIGb0232]|uniref:hypothetical protein n=1 Tax=Chryseobacterium sp. BIGb0232 TaxID=2940598 RepID=UPI000F46CF65|nr:hypothetical protein [Chryseobacterium sp. BIGb0232]MCS4301379.1 hypothetical protein [Chryseobacterium sp. BIGb0232]ROS19763.1 hypothetical protein EDF65_0458 [Chryseobacterium nakagawai]